jgi:hypothetical protein
VLAIRTCARYFAAGLSARRRSVLGVAREADGVEDGAEEAARRVTTQREEVVVDDLADGGLAVREDHDGVDAVLVELPVSGLPTIARAFSSAP